MPKLGLISLGCAKNLVDSEHMLARLRDAGWEITEDMTEADVGVVNTCGFIEAAKTDFDVVLVDAGSSKINVIKAVREITGLGLKEAKEKVDSAPQTIKEAAPEAEANEIKEKLEAAGAKVELK